MRGLIDRNGEQFAYFEGDMLYTLQGEPTGRRQGDYIVDLGGKRMWRVVGDGVYSIDSQETIGYISSEVPRRYNE